MRGAEGSGGEGRRGKDRLLFELTPRLWQHPTSNMHHAPRTARYDRARSVLLSFKLAHRFGCRRMLLSLMLLSSAAVILMTASSAVPALFTAAAVTERRPSHRAAISHAARSPPAQHGGSLHEFPLRRCGRHGAPRATAQSGADRGGRACCTTMQRVYICCTTMQRAYISCTTMQRAYICCTTMQRVVLCECCRATCGTKAVAAGGCGGPCSWCACRLERRTRAQVCAGR